MELWFSEFHAPDVKHSIRVNRHLYHTKVRISRLISTRHRNSVKFCHWMEMSC